MASFSNRLKRLRNEYNYSLRQLSALTNISASALHSYEIGNRNPKREALEALSDVFNCDMDYLEGKSDIRNSVANALGYNSLAEAYYGNKQNPTPTEGELDEGEKTWLDLYHRISEDSRDMLVKLVDAFDNLPAEERKFLLSVIELKLKK